MTEEIIRVVYDLDYLPKPNRVEIVLSDQLSPADLTPTSFCLPIDGRDVILANHQTRGLEVSGGHIEPGETAQQGAIRETLEETGCTVAGLVPIGYLRSIITAPCPPGYRYPYPVSYQQFFAARLVEQQPYSDNAECGQPARVQTFDGLRPSIGIFANVARQVIGATKR